MLMRIAGVTTRLPLGLLPLGLPRLARRVAPVALGLALRRLGGVADHLLDRLALLARLPFGLLLGLARSAFGVRLGFAFGPLRLAHGARSGDGLPLLPSPDHVGIVRPRSRLELLERLLPRLGGPGKPLLYVVVLIASHRILSGLLRRRDGLPPSPAAAKR